jgi:hypothetical protein
MRKLGLALSPLPAISFCPRSTIAFAASEKPTTEILNREQEAIRRLPLISQWESLPGRLGSKFVRPITFSVVMPMQFRFVITRDKSLFRIFRPLLDGFTS